MLPDHGDGALAGSQSTTVSYISITENLALALRQIRRRHRVSVNPHLWVDALCINQNDLLERSAQVQIMRLIFQSACFLYIWLGPEADDSTYAAATLHTLAARFKEDNAGSIIRSNSIKQDDGLDWVMSTDTIPYQCRDVASCRMLISRPWFERTWIRQEVYHAQDKAMVLMDNDYSIWWKELVFGTKVLNTRWTDPFTPADEKERYAGRVRMVKQLGGKESHSFRRLIAMGRSFKCSDPPDKVYGILGMLRDEDHWIARKLKPDYNLGVENLYSRVFEVLANRNRGLDLLGYCDPAPEYTWRPT